MKRRFLFISLAVAAVISCMCSPAYAQNARRIKVAVAQTANLDGQYHQARENAERLIVEAAQAGAQIILLPEFALVGYVFHDDIWKLAEPLDGPTTKWMKELARRHDVYLGLCILEVSGEDFYNAFVLVGPGEGQLWSHRKIEPATYEARYFKGGGVTPAVFETPLGRIGVSICADNSKTQTINNLLAGEPDLLLMAFSNPEIPIVPESVNQMSVTAQNLTPAYYADVLDVPVALVNKTGRWDSPLPGVPGVRTRADFVARSRIVSAEGEVLASLHKEETFALAEIQIKAVRHPDPAAVPEGRWLDHIDPLIQVFSDLTLKNGQRRYQRSQARKRAVQEAKTRQF